MGFKAKAFISINNLIQLLISNNDSFLIEILVMNKYLPSLLAFLYLNLNTSICQNIPDELPDINLTHLSNIQTLEYVQEYLSGLEIIEQNQIESLLQYLQQVGIPKHYLDLQSIEGITEKIAIDLFDECFTKKEKSVHNPSKEHLYYVGIQDCKSFNHNNNLKTRSRLRQKQHNAVLIASLEKDYGEPLSQIKAPYFADHLSLSFNQRKKEYDYYLGAFEASFGQGLILHQNILFGQGSSYINTELNSPILKSKSSFGEDNYFWGLGIHHASSKSSFFFSRRLLDGYFTDNDVKIRPGGYHDTALKLEQKNNVVEYAAGLFKSVGFQSIGELDFTLLSQVLKNPVGDNKIPALWSSIAWKKQHKNYRFFTEMAFHIQQPIGMTTLWGLSASLAYRTGISAVIQYNSNHINGLYVNHLFGNSNHKGIQTQFVFDKAFSTNLNVQIRAEQQLNINPRTKLGLNIHLKKRKAWHLVYTQRLIQKQEQASQWNHSLTFKQFLDSSIEIRFRFHYNTDWSNINRGNSFLAHDFIWAPLYQKSVLKLRIGFVQMAVTGNPVYAFENSPFGQFSIKQHNQTGLRYTINYRYKLKQGKTIELKHHGWITKVAGSIIPLEIQYRHHINS